MIEFNHDKAVYLRDRRDDLFAQLQRAGAALREATDRVQFLEGEIRRASKLGQPLTRWRPVKRTVTEAGTAVSEEARHIPILEDLERAKVIRAAKREACERLERELKPQLQLVGRLEAFLREHRVKLAEVIGSGALAVPEGPVPTLEELAEHRALLEANAREHRQLTRACWSQAEAYQAIDAWIEARASALRLDVGTFIRATSRQARAFELLPMPETTLPPATVERDVLAGLVGLQGQNGSGALAQVEALFLTVHENAVRTTLREAVNEAAAAAGGWGLPSSARRVRLQELEAERYELEVVEEQMVEALEAAGATVGRRGDADPRIVLGVVDTQAVPA